GAACLFVPFAYPPPGAEPVLVPPLAASIATWYLCGVACLLAGVHLLARALEGASGSPPAWGGRRWWSLRVVPLLVCLPCIGSTPGKGQVTPLLFLLIAAGITASLRGRRLAFGGWLALAACVKIFPAFLLAAPLWRRDWRALAGAGLGLAFGLVVLP